MINEGHARLGPSNKRWPMCPGSVREEERYPDIPGEAAIDGTGSHLLLELCLQNNVPAAQYDQQIIGANHHDNPNGWLVAPDRIARVQMALDYITRRTTELKDQFPGCTVTVESECKSDPGGAFGRTDWWGTCDITITARHPMIVGDAYFIEVADYKDGRMPVSEKDNSQNIGYMFGKMRKYVCSGPDLIRPFVSTSVHGCRMTIIQPKTTPVIRYQCTTRGDITVDSVIESAKGLSWAATNTDQKDAPLVSGDHCQWCKANPKRGGHCTEGSTQSLEVMETMSNNVAGDGSLFERINQVLADPKSLTEVQLSELADAEAGIQAVFDKVRGEIQSRIESGIAVIGYAMQPGNGSNTWNDTDEAIAKKLKGRRLKDAQIYKRKLISPVQMKALDATLLDDRQKDKLWSDCVTYSPGKVSLKKVAHAHAPVAQSPTDVVDLFNDIQPETAEVSFL